jgi:hypothetical protein
MVDWACNFQAAANGAETSADCAPGTVQPTSAMIVKKISPNRLIMRQL